MEEQGGRTATIAREKPAGEVADAAESRPLTITIPVSFPVEGKRRSAGKWIGRCVDIMLESQTKIEIEQVVVHVYLKDPDAWED